VLEEKVLSEGLGYCLLVWCGKVRSLGTGRRGDDLYILTLGSRMVVMQRGAFARSVLMKVLSTARTPLLLMSVRVSARYENSQKP
jgi:hypothetical protein